MTPNETMKAKRSSFQQNKFLFRCDCSYIVWVALGPTSSSAWASKGDTSPERSTLPAMHKLPVRSGWHS
eukprot:scaffold256402_cov28-Prasinocladus_malaysianus.AAC.1